MGLERDVFDFWKECMSPHRNRREVLFLLVCIRDQVQPVCAKMGIPWTDRAERVLIDSCLNYSSSWQCDFLTFFLRRLKGYQN